MNSDVESAETESESRGGRGESRFVHFTLGGLFLFALVYALYFGRDFFMPVVLAFLLALMLTPIVRFFG